MAQFHGRWQSRLKRRSLTVLDKIVTSISTGLLSKILSRTSNHCATLPPQFTASNLLISGLGIRAYKSMNLRVPFK
jgi:hypothetical protein